VNGKPRDSIATDVSVGRPTISPRGDALVRRVTALMSERDTERLFREIDALLEGSAGFRDWVLDPSQHLAAFDPSTAAAIEAVLDREYKQQLQRADGRGQMER
jgi:hypothetical protein